MKHVKKIILSTILTSVALAGCQATQNALRIGEAAESNPGPCPRAFSLYDAERVVKFTSSDESFANVTFTGQFGKMRSLCRYFGEEPITADLTMDIEFGRGPSAQSNTHVYEYFVAVTRKNIDVIEKETFPISVTFPEGSNRVTVRETVERIVIPRVNATTSGENFEIIVGFEVTPEQRAFNVAGKRFRVDVGQN